MYPVLQEVEVQSRLKRKPARPDTELIEMALANLAAADQYPDWLLSQQGTVAKEADLEF